jgi:hypothetical protein
MAAKQAVTKAGKPAKKTRVPTTKRQLTFTVITNWQLGVAAAKEGMTVSQFVAKCLREHLRQVDCSDMPARLKRLSVFDETEDVAA